MESEEKECNKYDRQHRHCERESRAASLSFPNLHCQDSLLDGARLSSPIDGRPPGAVADVLSQARHALAVHLHLLLAVAADLQVLCRAQFAFAGCRSRNFLIAQVNRNHDCSPSCHVRRFIIARCKCDFTVPGLRFVARAISSIDIPSTALNSNASRCGGVKSRILAETRCSRSRRKICSSGVEPGSRTCCARSWSSSE